MAWNTWVESVAEEVESRHKLAKAMQFFTSNQIALAFYHWSNVAGRRRHCREVASAFLKRLQHRDLTKAIAQWVDFVHEAREVRERQPLFVF